MHQQHIPEVRFRHAEEFASLAADLNVVGHSIKTTHGESDTVRQKVVEEAQNEVMYYEQQIARST